jgi:hypothetical protein
LTFYTSEMVKIGLITTGVGLAAVLCSLPFGTGPCGPGTIPGAMLFYSGIPAFLTGCGIVVVGLIVKLIRRIRRPNETSP